MADQTTGRGTDAPAGTAGSSRQRRSDQHWRSRRRRRKREKVARRESRDRQRADREARRTAVREAADREAGTADRVEASAPEPETPVDLGRTERRLLARERRRRAGLRTGLRVVAGMALVAAAIGLGAGLRLVTRDDDATASAEDVDGALPAGTDPQPALLLVTAEEDADPRSADSVILLAYDRIADEATILIIPATTVADVPGHGVLPLGDALAFGGGGLVIATVDNLLGLHVDAVADLTYRDWEGLFSRVGAVDVEISERLVSRNADGTGDVRFLAGIQSLDPGSAAEFLAFEDGDEPELSRLPRLQRLLLAEFAAMAGDPQTLERVVGDGLPMLDTEMASQEVADLLRQIALATVEDRLDVRVLPVRPIGAGGADGYRPDELRVEALVADRFAASMPTSDRAGRQLQILNGMGRPGIGQSVAEILVPAGYRVVLTGNADDFDHDVTRILVYDDSPEQLAIANEIKRLLGVGIVEVSRTPQSVVDVTIVVGQDYGDAVGDP